MPRSRSSTELPVLYSYIYIPKDYLSSIIAEDQFRQVLETRLRVTNPAWISKSRFSTFKGWKHSTPEFLRFYKEDDSGFYVPRNFDFELPEIDDYTEPGRKISFELEGSKILHLRDYQDQYLTENPGIISDRDKVLNVSCGGGKTVLGIYLSHLYGVTTLVLVPTHFLAQQWVARIKEFTDASWHIWKSTDKAIPRGKNFYVCSFDLFTVREMPEWFKKDIGHVILDEGHRMGAQTYLPILGELPAKRRTALTATFRRADGMHQILHYQFGSVYSMNYTPIKPAVHPVTTGIKVGYVYPKKGNWEALRAFISDISPVTETQSTIQFEWPEKGLESLTDHLDGLKLPVKEKQVILRELKKAQKQSFTILDNHLSEHPGRMRKTVAILHKCLKAGRTVLFISKRIKALKTLHKLFAEYRPVLVIGGSTDDMTPEERVYMEKEARLIFGVAQLAKEGLDIDRLDTLILHLPIKDVEQPIGRINRIREGKKRPVALVMLDDNQMCRGMYMASKKYIAINGTFGRTIKWNEVKSIL